MWQNPNITGETKKKVLVLGLPVLKWNYYIGMLIFLNNFITVHFIKYVAERQVETIFYMKLVLVD